MSAARSRAALFAAVLAFAFLGGCATTAGTPDGQQRRNALRDPLEPLNRVVFSFNDTVDRILLEPVAELYVELVPDVGKLMFRSFVGNIADVWTAGNNLLQGKPRAALSDLSRVVINTTFGLFGVADVASEMGLEKNREDFGQTLGRWGMEPGPYLVLPFLGPSSLRDGVGVAVDMAADPTAAVVGADAETPVKVVGVIDTRARLLRVGRLVDTFALDRYLAVRNGYLQRRRSQVYDGDPPPEPDPGLDNGAAPR